MFGEKRSKTMRVPLKGLPLIVFVDEAPASVPDGSQNELASQYQNEQSSADEKRKSVHEWIRVPVPYDDLLGDDLKSEA
ncbi:hypothetical protein NC652_039526 [Populus alba x Populus x berolinensis]|uniref:Uncharacterized protein n=2 Tax=Populus TaxID=3689 RepID=A0ACC4AJR6_POPAL|nr:hypothetical protein NC652_039526 [Populus alba x Populus x berolinensis]KAJ6957574.1 hypothetical protein NC653_039513 [Populus alba x Populus x berolinensis]